MATPDIYIGALARYPAEGGFSSAFDPLDDLIVHLSFLGAQGYTADLLIDQHQVPMADARRRAIAIRPHADLAGSYLAQARSGSVETSFVSAYYGLLNLIKICILTSPQHSRLASNRLHGASYDPTAPLSRVLPSEEVTLHRTGAIPLFYEVVTGKSLSAKLQISMGEIYPYISDVGAEWDLAAPGRWRRILLKFEIADRPVGRVSTWTIVQPAVRKPVPVKHLPALPGFRRLPGSSTAYELTTALPQGTPPAQLFSAGIDRRYLWVPLSGLTTTAVMPGPLAMVEELPILIAFFHLASVARYNPEFLERLRASRYWPVAAAMRPHALFKFLMLFWSFLRNASVTVDR